MRRLLAKIVQQGGQVEKIAMLFRELRVAAAREYTEDNLPTRKIFLKEIFDSTAEK